MFDILLVIGERFACVIMCDGEGALKIGILCCVTVQDERMIIGYLVNASCYTNVNAKVTNNHDNNCDGWINSSSNSVCTSFFNRRFYFWLVLRKSQAEGGQQQMVLFLFFRLLVFIYYFNKLPPPTNHHHDHHQLLNHD